MIDEHSLIETCRPTACSGKTDLDRALDLISSEARSDHN